MRQTRHYHALDVGLDRGPCLPGLRWAGGQQWTQVAWCYGGEDGARGESVIVLDYWGLLLAWAANRWSWRALLSSMAAWAASRNCDEFIVAGEEDIDSGREEKGRIDSRHELCLYIALESNHKRRLGHIYMHVVLRKVDRKSGGPFRTLLSHFCFGSSGAPYRLRRVCHREICDPTFPNSPLHRLWAES